MLLAVLMARQTMPYRACLSSAYRAYIAIAICYRGVINANRHNVSHIWLAT